MRKLFFIALSCMVLLQAPLLAKPTYINLSGKSKMNSAVRSLIGPGWGQFYNGQKTKGYIVAAGTVISVASAFYYFDQENKKYDDYSKKGLKNDSLYNDYTTCHDNALNSCYVAGAFWLFAVVDAYIFGGEKKNEGSASAPRGFSVVSDRDSTYLMFKRSF